MTRCANASRASWVASLPQTQQQAFLASLTDAELSALQYDWTFWSRRNQRPPPGDWTVWLISAGRGSGKTRTGAETVRAWKDTTARIHLVGPTAAAVRDVMVEGESGLLSVAPSWDRPLYEPSKRRLTWPNGAIATCFSAEDPDQLRGPQCGAAWCDELGAWRYMDTWDMLMLGLRLGDRPRCVVTTTPRPTRVLRDLYSRAGGDVALTTGSTYDNRANLAPAFFKEIVSRYEGTRLGRQEIHAQLLEEAEGALWSRAILDDTRVSVAPALRRIVVSIDPSATGKASSNEAGVVVAALGADKHGYVLEDATAQLSPASWARLAVAKYRAYKADAIVVETNNGGEMCEQVIRSVDPNVRVVTVWASRGKYTRAEPIAGLYEQQRIHHVGSFAKLEDELCNYARDVDWSPNRLDALVWAFTELMVDNPAVECIAPVGIAGANYWGTAA